MRFRIEQRFRADVAEVGRALTDAAYLATAMAQLPDLGRPEVLQCLTDARGVVTLQLAYRFGGRLPKVATRVIDPDKLSWTEDTVVDPANWIAQFRITPAHYQSYLSCCGTWTLAGADTEPGVTIRRFDGSLTVNAPVPFVGGQVEKAIVSGLRERLDEEPPILERWVADRTERSNRSPRPE